MMLSALAEFGVRPEMDTGEALALLREYRRRRDEEDVAAYERELLDRRKQIDRTLERLKLRKRNGTE